MVIRAVRVRSRKDTELRGKRLRPSLEILSEYAKVHHSETDPLRFFTFRRMVFRDREETAAVGRLLSGGVGRRLRGGTQRSARSDPLIDRRALRLCGPSATDESLSQSATRHHCRLEPSEVSLSPRGCGPEPHHPVTDCRACRTPGSIPMYGNSRTRRRSGSVLSVPSSPVSLVGDQRSRTLSER